MSEPIGEAAESALRYWRCLPDAQRTVRELELALRRMDIPDAHAASSAQRLYQKEIAA